MVTSSSIRTPAISSAECLHTCIDVTRYLPAYFARIIKSSRCIAKIDYRELSSGLSKCDASMNTIYIGSRPVSVLFHIRFIFT